MIVILYPQEGKWEIKGINKETLLSVGDLIEMRDIFNKMMESVATPTFNRSNKPIPTNG